MKKILISSIMMMIGLCFTGCSSDDDFLSASSEKTTDVRAKILSMAEEYGVNIKINDANLDYYEDKEHLDSLESFLQGISKIKGTYLLTRKKDGSIHQMPRHTREQIKTWNKEYDFDEENIKGYKCKCSLSYQIDNKDEISNIQVSAWIDFDDLTASQTGGASGYADSYGTIYISGSINLSYEKENDPFILSDNELISVDFYVSGTYSDKEGGSITWS